MKRVISLLLTFLMLLTSVSVMAATPASVTAKADYTAKTIDVVYTNTAPYDCYVTIYMVDADLYDDATFDALNVSGSVIRTATVEAPKNSDVEIELVFGSDIKTGNYNVYAAPSGVNGASYYAKIAQPLPVIGETADTGDETISSVLAYINAGSSSDISDRVYDKLSVALDISSKPAWRNAYLYDVRTYDFAGHFATITDVDNAIAIADALYPVKTSTIDTLQANLEANASVLGIDITNSDYVAYTSAFLTLFNTKIQSAMSKTQMQTAFNETAAMIAVNNRSTSSKALAFSEYQSELGISDTMLSQITAAGSETVARNMENVTFTKPSDVTDKITTILSGITADADEPVVSYRPSGSGGSGGGGVTLPDEFVTQQGSQDYSTTFSDVPDSHWANVPVEYLAKLGVVAGKGNGIFSPDSIVTREEFVKMIVSAFKYTNAGDGIDFEDVPTTHWAYSYIKIAYENDIVKGISDTKFGIGSPITRQDMAVIIMRVLGDEAPSASKSIAFADQAQIAPYAKDAVLALANAGVINGYSDGTFRPEGSLTRAEAAKVIYALIVK